MTVWQYIQAIYQATFGRRSPGTALLQELWLWHPRPVPLETLELHSRLERGAFTALIGAMGQDGLIRIYADGPRPLPGRPPARGSLGLSPEGWAYCRDRGMS